MSLELESKLNKILNAFYTRRYIIQSRNSINAYPTDCSVIDMCEVVKEVCNTHGFENFIESGLFEDSIRVFGYTCDVHDMDALPYFEELVVHPVFRVFDCIYTVAKLDEFTDDVQQSIRTRALKGIETLPAEWVVLFHSYAGKDSIHELIPKLNLKTSEKDLLNLCGVEDHSSLFKVLKNIRTVTDIGKVTSFNLPEM